MSPPVFGAYFSPGGKMDKAWMNAVDLVGKDVSLHYKLLTAKQKPAKSSLKAAAIGHWVAKKTSDLLYSRTFTKWRLP